MVVGGDRGGAREGCDGAGARGAGLRAPLLVLPPPPAPPKRASRLAPASRL